MYKVVVYEITGYNGGGYAETKEILDIAEVSFNIADLVKVIYNMEGK